MLMAPMVAAAAPEAHPPPQAKAHASAPQVGTDQRPARKLRVGVAGSKPFAIFDGPQPSGLAVDVWREVARRTGVRYEIGRVRNVDEAIRQVAAGDLDVAVGPISITARRARQVFFTQPYHQSSLAIAARSEDVGITDFLSPFVSKAFIYGTASLLSVLLLVGVLLWVTERKKNQEMFPSHPVRGIGNGIWLALVTMTTVGYGDRVPVTLAGRVVGGIWMVVAMLSISSLTAGIATTLTVASLSHGTIQSAGELSGRRVAALRGSTAEDFARKHGARVVRARSIEQALALLEQGEADALVGDRPILRYALAQANHSRLEVADAVYEPQGYGFAVQSSEMARNFELAILRAGEAGRIEAITERWLEDGAPD